MYLFGEIAKSSHNYCTSLSGLPVRKNFESLNVADSIRISSDIERLIIQASHHHHPNQWFCHGQKDRIRKWIWLLLSRPFQLPTDLYDYDVTCTNESFWLRLSYGSKWLKLANSKLFADFSSLELCSGTATHSVTQPFKYRCSCKPQRFISSALQACWIE